MGYLKNYKHDIFISYSHIDNEMRPGEAVPWIEDFYKNLSVMLWQSFGTKDVKIWWDNKRLDGGTLFDDEIKEAIESSAIFLCLNSPAYLKSEYCKKELDLFYNHVQKQSPGLKVGKHSRIINALLTNIPYTTWPKELSGTSGFKFHDAVDTDSRGHRLSTRAPQFNDVLQTLADCIVAAVEEFSTGSTPVIEEKKFTILFADVVDTLITARRRTMTELEKEEVKIISDVPPPYQLNEHETFFKERVEQADLTVHLLDQCPGKEIENKESIWYTQTQAKICRKSNKPQLIWVPEEMKIEMIEEDSYKQFMESLEAGEKSSKQIEYIRGKKSELPQQIKEYVAQLQVKNKPVAVSNGKVPVLLDTHYNDQLYALEMSRSLIENNIQPYINPQSDDPLENISILKDRISQVKSLIFFYGNVGRDWVLERMKAARQEIVINDYPIEEFYVYMLPPHKDPGDQSLKQRFIKLNVLNNSDMPQLDTITLQQMLTNIKALHD